MSTSLPTSTTPPPATNASALVLPAGTLPLVPETSLPMVAGASPSAMGVMSNAELTAAVLDLGKMVAGIHAFLLGPQGPQSCMRVRRPALSRSRSAGRRNRPTDS